MNLIFLVKSQTFVLCLMKVNIGENIRMWAETFLIIKSIYLGD